MKNIGTMFSFVVLPALFVAACSDGATVNDCIDPAAAHKCQDGLCHECCIDSNCPTGESCSADFVCEASCVQEGEDCPGDASTCCDGLCCDIFTNRCLAACASDSDCAALHPDLQFNADMKCEAPCCDFVACHDDSDCPPGKVCNGDCVTKPDCPYIASCQVAPASAFLQEGDSAEFGASAYFTSGALAPGLRFTWSSGSSGVVLVDADGLATGGSETGSASIYATPEGCTISCSAEVTNYASVTSGTRVVVVDKLAGNAIEGATVLVGNAAPRQTDANGVAEFALELSDADPADVTVSRKDYNYLTLRGVRSNDLIVHLGRLYHLDFSSDPPHEVAGGIRGKFDYNRIHCEPGHTCDVHVGLAGLSSPDSLVNLNFEQIFGAKIKTVITLGDVSREVAIPAGVSFCVNASCFKEFYSPTGIPGTRVAWGLGGKMDLQVLIDKLAPIISGGEDVDVPSLLVDLLPRISGFYSSMKYNFLIVPRDKIEDSDNIDDDESTTHVPDYDNFPHVDMTLKVAMDQELTIAPPALPLGTYDGVVVIAGVIVRGAGLVPLGIGIGLDSLNKDDPPDGVIDGPIVVNVSSVAGRIPEDLIQRAVVAVALNIESLARKEQQPLMLAGQVKFLPSFSGYHVLETFITPPQATYDPVTRHLNVTEMPLGIDYTQLVFAGDKDVNWHILGEWTTGGYDLPSAPITGDRSKRAYFIGIKLNDRMGNITYQDLPMFNDTNLGNLVDLMGAFCFSDIRAP